MVNIMEMCTLYQLIGNRLWDNAHDLSYMHFIVGGSGR